MLIVATKNINYIQFLPSFSRTDYKCSYFVVVVITDGGGNSGCELKMKIKTSHMGNEEKQ